MSHFVVLVLGDDVEDQLAPYQENNMDDCPEEYLKFNDCTEEVLEKYESDTEERIKMPNGTLVDIRDKQFKHTPDEEKPWKTEYKYPENTEKVEVPVKKLYTSVEQFAEEYYGYESHDNKLGYWENPNAKWDWYAIGGRWSNSILLKTEGDFEEYADSAKIKDIDFGGMVEKRVKAANKEYESMAALGTIGPGAWVPWKELLNKFQDKNDETFTTIEDTRDFYHAQANLKQIKEGTKDIHFFYDWDDLLLPKEEFITLRVGAVLPCYALIDEEGVWHAKGTMGWFGVSDDTTDDITWGKKVFDKLQKVSPDTPLTVIDCHI